MPMALTDEQYIDSLAAAGAADAQCDAATARRVIIAALKQADVDLSDLRRMGSGDYTLCDGYCQGS